MKLDLTYDHAGPREAARRAIVVWFSRQSGDLILQATIHAAKMRAAAREPRDGVYHALTDDAAARGLSLDAMRDLVRIEADAIDTDLFALDRQRRDALMALDAATTGPAITAIHHRFSGA